MKKRVISGIVMTAIVIPVLYLGGIVFDIGILLLSILAYREIMNAQKEYSVRPYVKIISVFIMLLITFNNQIDFKLFEFSISKIALAYFLLLIPTILDHKSGYTSRDALYLVATTLFIGCLFNSFLNIYNESIFYLIYVILVACMTDIFALFGGKLIGKHKFTPISPNKTIEGCIVGSIISTIVGTTFFYTVIGGLNIVAIGIITLILSIVGQIGDLFFSLIKRENDIKDYSNLIPGHGGILDRLDSILFIMIVFSFILEFI